MKAAMDYYNPYAATTVSEQPSETRAAFIRKTYWHLAGAIAVFALLEVILLQMGFGETALVLLSTGKVSWMMVLGGYMLVSWIADRWARGSTSLASQYGGLALYVLAEAIIFLPMVAAAPLLTDDPLVVGKAGVVTGALVLGLTVIAFTTRKDFTFLGGMLKVGGLIALGVIIASFFLPITLGVWFSVIMVVFAAGCILYNTSAMLYHYQPGQHVAASLSLFSSVALLFWYILRIFMSRD